MGRKKNTEILSKKQLAYNGIREMITNGELKKDTPLVERQLCGILGVSRTPVREALRELANDNLVEIIEGKGVYVKQVEFRDMIEIFEIREALECMAMKLFMERKEAEDIETLKQCFFKQEEAYKNEAYDKFMKVDMQFHALISDGARNKRLRDEISNIYKQVRQIAIASKDDEEVRNFAMKAHKKIIGAVLEDDKQKAQDAIVEHIVEVKNIHKNRYYLF